MSKTPVPEVEMKDEGAAKTEVEKKPTPEPPSPVQEIKVNVTLIERAVSTLEPRFTHRILRTLTALRRKVNAKILRDAVAEVYHREGSVKKRLLSWIPSSETLTVDMDVEPGSVSRNANTPVPAPTPPKPHPTAEPLPETEIYFSLLILYHLLDAKAPREKALNLAHETVDKIHSFDRRSLDPIAAKVWFATGRVYEIEGKLADLRPRLFNAQRTASLRHDTETLAVLINLLLRSYLLTSSYGAASTLLSKLQYPDSSVPGSTTPVTSSPVQLSRYLYYVGRVRAVELSYTDARSYLMQATRRAPKAEQAPGFWQEVHKWLIVVELLMGDIPERGIFRQPVLRKALEGYFEIVRAVRTGSLSQFQSTLQTYNALFTADKTYTLILRLRQNVIKTGIRRLSLSYSRISLRDICVKLHLDSEEDAEYIVGKAIRDGVIEARIVHEKGWLECGSENKGSYGAEVGETFNRRIAFCLGLHNESVKAMRYPLNAHRKELDAAEGARSREKELAKEIAEGDLDEDDDPMGGSEF